MYNNLITNLINLPDLVATDLIQTEEYLVFVVDCQKEYVKYPICGKKVNKNHNSDLPIGFDFLKIYYVILMLLNIYFCI